MKGSTAVLESPIESRRIHVSVASVSDGAESEQRFAKIRDHRPTEVYALSDDPTELPSMDVVEERYIRKVLAAVGGNKTLAAKVLGFDRRTLYRKLKQQQS